MSVFLQRLRAFQPFAFKNRNGLVPGSVHFAQNAPAQMNGLLKGSKHLCKVILSPGFKSDILRESSQLLRAATSHIYAYLHTILHNNIAYCGILPQYAFNVKLFSLFFKIFLQHFLAHIIYIKCIAIYLLKAALKAFATRSKSPSAICEPEGMHTPLLNTSTPTSLSLPQK